jgi:predicted Rossmann fold flavoprotein
VIIGAGAAGLVAALFAAEKPVPVVVLEGTADGGRKILISGGGRCNILPAAIQPQRFVTDSPPAILRGVLRSWPLAGMQRFFEHDLSLPLAFEADTGKWFPASHKARDVRDALVRTARTRGVDLRWSTRVTSLDRVGSQWRIGTTAGTLDASRVIVATGGLSVPATGSDGLGLSLARQLGLPCHPTYAALTPLTCDDERMPGPWKAATLAGISLPVRVRARWNTLRADAAGGFLFTHRGYSGPAVLDVSHVCVRSLEQGTGDALASLQLAFTDRSEDDWHGRLQSGDQLAATVLGRALPDRLVTALMHTAGVPVDRRVSSLRRDERIALVRALTQHALPWTGHEGYRKAEVTGGGVALDAVHGGSLEVRTQPGLHLCGEVLDAFGPIGGHNFAWAWATGRLAGLGAAKAAAADGLLY